MFNSAIRLFILLSTVSSAMAGEPLVVSTAKPADVLMHEAMTRMERDMRAAPMTGDSDRDFVAMMLPHHQGAVDMAKVLLLYGKDPALRTLAQQIVTEQQTEINLMRAWLQGHARENNPSTHPNR